MSLSEDVTIPDSVLDDSGICFPDDGKFNGEFFEFLINFPFRKFSAENGKWKAELRGEGKALPIPTLGSSALTSSDLSSVFEGRRGQPTPNLTPMSPKENLDEELLLRATPSLSKETKKEQREKIPAERDTELFEEDAVIFQLAEWNHVSLWKWNVDCDVCAICREVICDPCLTVSQIKITV